MVNIRNLLTSIILLYIAIIVGIYASYIDYWINLLLCFILQNAVYKFPVAFIISVILSIAGITSIYKNSKL